MPIFYSIIVKNNETILAESNQSSGNYPQITMRYLKSNKVGDGFKTFANQDYVYYMLNERPLTYLCLCEAGFSKVRCMSYLKDVRDRFVLQFPEEEIASAVAYAFNRRFETIMTERMSYFNESTEQEGKLKGLVNQLQDVKELMDKNVESIEERGEKIALLKKTTEQMKGHAIVFHKKARKLKEKTKWERWWKKIVLCILFFYTVCYVLFVVPLFRNAFKFIKLTELLFAFLKYKSPTVSSILKNLVNLISNINIRKSLENIIDKINKHIFFVFHQTCSSFKKKIAKCT